MGLWDLLSLQNILLFNITLFLLYLGYMSRRFLVFRRMGIKGPTPIPVFGNMLPALHKDVVVVDAELMAKYRDIGYCGTFESDLPVLMVFNLDAMREITIKQFGSFVNRRRFEILETFPLTHLLPTMRDDPWKHVRNQLTPAFSSGRLKRMMPLIDDCCQDLVEVFQKAADSGADVEIKEIIAAFIMDAIGRTAFGLQTDSQKNRDNPFVSSAKAFFDYINILVVAIFFPFLTPVFKLLNFKPVAQKHVDFFVNLILTALKERQQDTSGKYRDFMQMMANAEMNPEDKIDADIDHSAALKTSSKWTNQGLSKEDIIGSGILFLVAGYETTTSAICFLLHLLAVHPECQDRARKEVDEVLQGGRPTQETVVQLNYLEMCVLETLRLYPVAPRMDRMANEDAVVNGLTIPKGMVVSFPVGAIQKDPEYWPEPDKFDPERFTPEKKAERHPMTYLPFGAGPRNCIGMRLALMEAKMSVAAILQKFRIVPGEKTENPIKVKRFGHATAENGFWLKIQKRA